MIASALLVTRSLAAPNPPVAAQSVKHSYLLDLMLRHECDILLGRRPGVDMVTRGGSGEHANQPFGLRT
jgi:hypothetical protein